MEATKQLMDHNINTKLELSLESECRILLQQWTSQAFFSLAKEYVRKTAVEMQASILP